MNIQTKFALLAGMIVLLLSACGPSGAAREETSELPAAAEEHSTDTSTVIPVKNVVPEPSGTYIGLNYPPLPAGLSEDMGMMIQDTDDHALSLISDGENKMLWLGKMTHRDADGNAYWVVKDVLGLSDLEPGLTLLPDGCLLNGAPDHEIFVVGRDEAIQMAWRANTQLDRFESIPTAGIECHSDKALDL